MKNIEKGKLINLKDQIDYIEGGIANLDLVSRDNLKIVLMAFDKGEGLAPHSAPGDALVLALEGSAQVQVADEVMELEAGSQVIFPKDINHAVTAKDQPFKMCLVLDLGE